MKKMMLTLAAAASALTATTPASAAPIGEWYGTYSYTESLGRIGGGDRGDGVAAFVDYRLTFTPDGCTLRIVGYQTNQMMKCTVTPEMDSAIVKFYTFRPSSLPYYSGQPLFRMTRLLGGALVTRFQGLTLSDGSRPSGRYFR